MKKSVRKGQKKRKGRKAGIIAAGVTVVLYAMLFPLYRIADFVICGLLALLAGKVIGAMGEGLDLTTHNKQDQKAQPKPVEELPLSGNGDADAVIARGQEMLHTIRAENDAITDEVLSGQMDELERLCVQIFTTVAEKPQKAPQIRKFMNYYLPTTLKMLVAFRRMEEGNVTGESADNARQRIRESLDMVIEAFNKQLARLYEDDALDITTDIDVLETMLKQDGLIDSGLRTRTSTGEEK